MLNGFAPNSHGDGGGLFPASRRRARCKSSRRISRRGETFVAAKKRPRRPGRGKFAIVIGLGDGVRAHLFFFERPRHFQQTIHVAHFRPRKLRMYDFNDRVLRTRTENSANPARERNCDCKIGAAALRRVLSEYVLESEVERSKERT